jgi:predicted HicB family RNase H-like nuclease
MAPERVATQLRLPADLHAELTRRAAEQGVSFNALLVALLAGAVGFNLKKKGGRK